MIYDILYCCCTPSGNSWLALAFSSSINDCLGLLLMCVMHISGSICKTSIFPPSLFKAAMKKATKDAMKSNRPTLKDMQKKWVSVVGWNNQPTLPGFPYIVSPTIAMFSHSSLPFLPPVSPSIPSHIPHSLLPFFHKPKDE